MSRLACLVSFSLVQSPSLGFPSKELVKEDGKENGSSGSSNKQISRLSKLGNVSGKGRDEILERGDICLSKVKEKQGKDGLCHSIFFSKKEEAGKAG